MLHNAFFSWACFARFMLLVIDSGGAPLS